MNINDREKNIWKKSGFTENLELSLIFWHLEGRRTLQQAEKQPELNIVTL